MVGGFGFTEGDCDRLDALFRAGLISSSEYREVIPLFSRDDDLGFDIRIDNESSDSMTCEGLEPNSIHL